jgi:hypothetical protein
MLNSFRNPSSPDVVVCPEGYRNDAHTNVLALCLIEVAIQPCDQEFVSGKIGLWLVRIETQEHKTVQS